MEEMKRLFGIFKRKAEKDTSNNKKWLVSNGYNYFKEGTKYFKAKRDQDALECFDKAIESGFEDEGVYGLRGICLQSLHFDLDAIDNFNKAISLDPKDCNWYCMRSFSRQSIGDFEGCITDLQDAIMLSEVDNKSNKAYNIAAQEMGYKDATSFYRYQLFSAKIIDSCPEIKKTLKQRIQEKPSPRRNNKDIHS